MATTTNIRTALALAALTLTGGCAGMFEPTAHWWRDGGRLCTAPETALDFDRPTARSCAQAFADEIPMVKEDARLILADSGG